MTYILQHDVFGTEVSVAIVFRDSLNQPELLEQSQHLGDRITRLLWEPFPVERVVTIGEATNRLPRDITFVGTATLGVECGHEITPTTCKIEGRQPPLLALQELLVDLH